MNNSENSLSSDEEIQKHLHKELIRRTTDVYLESFKSSVRHGENACKALMLVNGGASIALLAFLGNTWDKMHLPGTLYYIGLSMLAFGFGVFMSIVCAGTTYFAQGNYTNHAADGDERHLNAGRNWSLVAVFAGLISALSFLSGLGLSFFALQAQFPAI